MVALLLGKVYYFFDNLACDVELRTSPRSCRNLRALLFLFVNILSSFLKFALILSIISLSVGPPVPVSTWPGFYDGLKG